MRAMPDAELAGLWAEHAPAARRAALRAAPAADADDLVAESFTRILGAVRSGRDVPEDFRPYWAATVRHEAARAGRHRARLVPVPDPEPAPGPGADQPVLDAAEAALVRQAYRCLPARWQEVLWAAEVDRVPPRVLAGRMGLTADAVAQLAARAREGLRQAYLAVHAPCPDFADALAARVRGQLGPRRLARLDAHLASCGRCQVASGELAALNARLGQVLAPAVLAAVLGRAARRSWWHPAAWTAGAASVAAAAAVVVLPLHPGPPSHVPAPPGRVQAAPARPVSRPAVHDPARHAGTRRAGQVPAGEGAASPVPAPSAAATRPAAVPQSSAAPSATAAAVSAAASVTASISVPVSGDGGGFPGCGRPGRGWASGDATPDPGQG